MSRGVIVAAAVLALGLAGDASAANIRGTLENSRNNAATTVQQATGKPGADKYINYLNGLISEADCYLNSNVPSATCNCTDDNAGDLIAALDEGAKATRYLTAERQPVKTVQAAQATTPASATSNATNKNTTAKTAARTADVPDSLPEASYETASVAKDVDVTEPEAKDDMEYKEVATAEVPEVGEQASQTKTGVKDDAPVRIGLSMLAGAAILTAGVMVIWKWSKGNA